MSPGLEERLHSLLRRQSPDEHGIPACARTGAWIGVGEVGFDRDLVCGQAPFDELAATEFGESDIHIDCLPPSAQRSMRREHRRDRGAGGAAVTVALVHDARPGKRFSETVFADLAVAKQERIGAEKTKVMQGLDDANVLCPGGIVGGRRDQRKRVVEMGDLRPMRSEQFSQLAERRAAPDRARRDLCRRLIASIDSL